MSMIIGDGKEILHHHYAVIYSEDFLKEKGLWDEFIKYAEAEEAKKPKEEHPPYPVD